MVVATVLPGRSAGHIGPVDGDLRRGHIDGVEVFHSGAGVDLQGDIIDSGRRLATTTWVVAPKEDEGVDTGVGKGEFLNLGLPGAL